MNNSIKVTSVAYHRNGVGGNGFHVVLFTEGRGADKDTKVATVFPERGSIAVLSVPLLAEGNITFGVNSWRGDTYESDIRAAIRQWTIDTYGYDPDKDDEPETEEAV